MSTWELRSLARADDDRQWGSAIHWRPRQDELIHWAVLKRLLAFNYPFFLLGMGVTLGLVCFAWNRSGGDPWVNLGAASTWIVILLVSALTALALDLYACYRLARAWNKRVLGAEQAELA